VVTGPRRHLPSKGRREIRAEAIALATEALGDVVAIVDQVAAVDARDLPGILHVAHALYVEHRARLEREHVVSDPEEDDTKPDVRIPVPGGFGPARLRVPRRASSDRTASSSRVEAHDFCPDTPHPFVVDRAGGLLCQVCGATEDGILHQARTH